MRPCGIVAQWLKIPKISILFPKKTSKYPGIIQDEKIFARYLLELVTSQFQPYKNCHLESQNLLHFYSQEPAKN